MARILIIDDSPTDVHVFSTLLEKAGHQVTSASTAEEGIVLVRRDHPDLVIMDVVMPGMSGFQATRQLSHDAETASIPILIITKKSMDVDKLWGLRQGAKDFMSKPVRGAELLTRINNLVAA